MQRIAHLHESETQKECKQSRYARPLYGLHESTRWNSRTISRLLDCVSRKIKIDVAALPNGDNFVPAFLFNLTGWRHRAS